MRHRPLEAALAIDLPQVQVEIPDHEFKSTSLVRTAKLVKPDVQMVSRRERPKSEHRNAINLAQVLDLQGFWIQDWDVNGDPPRLHQ
jgi:hypothetical protein